MFSNNEHSKKVNTFLIISGFILLLLLGYGWYITLEHNNGINRVTIYTPDKQVSVNIKANSADSDKWVTGLQMSEDPQDLESYIGETCNCNIENSKKYALRDWTLTLRIVQDCYLNGFWCGDFEVHQFRDKKEIVEIVKNGQTDVSKSVLEYHKYSNNPMIHLQPGDYLVYLPSETVQETEIKPHSSIGIGFIFYYKDYLDFSSYELLYRNDFKFTDSFHFYIIIALLILWLLTMVFYCSFVLAKRKYVKEINNSIRNLSFMADLYNEVHMINLASDSGYLIKGDSQTSMFNFVGFKVSACFKKYIEEDCVPDYKKDLSSFLDIKTTTEIMKNATSIVFEYESISKGWCSLRFFKIEKQGHITNLVFTVQDINQDKIDEKTERAQIRQREYSELVRNQFLKSISFAINGMLAGILQLNQMINESLTSPQAKESSSRINYLIEHLKILQLCVSDMHEIEAHTLKVKNQQYDLNALLDKLINIHKPYLENKPFEFQKDIASDIPPVLLGDEARILEILALILYSAINITNKGYVKFSVFAKRIGDNEELLFSIRDTGCGFTEDELLEIRSFIKDEKITSFDNPALVYLKIIDGILRKMGSELKIVSEFGSGSEFYFSLQQKIVETGK